MICWRSATQNADDEDVKIQMCATKRKIEELRWVADIKIGAILTQWHRDNSENPASSISGRHIVDVTDQSERPSRWERLGGVASMNERRLSDSLRSQGDVAGDE